MNRRVSIALLQFLTACHGWFDRDATADGSPDADVDDRDDAETLSDTDPCSGVTCSGHGDCFSNGRDAVCVCESGFHDIGLECVENVVDGDMGPDADVDWECVFPGQRTEPCGLCGVRTSVCTQEHQWSAWTDCEDEGECTPGETSTSACDPCSHRVCAEDCAWGACQLQSGNQCEFRDGTNYRCCGSGMWEFCISSCEWSGDCTVCSECC